MRKQHQDMYNELVKHSKQVEEVRAKKKELLDKAAKLLDQQTPVDQITPCEPDVESDQ